MHDDTTELKDEEKVTGARRVATLDSLSASQIAAIRAIPPYGDTPPPVTIATRPASIFSSPERFELERTRVFRRLAVPVTLSAMLPEPGTALAHDGYGVPILLTRAKDGVVRAFLNACRHKGAKLVEDCETRKLGLLTCPYHAWTYNLHGQCRGIARQDAFGDIDKSLYGLAALACRESGGLIWVSLNRAAAPDFSALSPDLDADLVALRIPQAHVYGRRTFEVKANWKLVMEPFLESYHVPRLHASSVGPLFGDVTRIVDRLGPHQRKVAGKVQYHPDMLDAPGENIHKIVTHAYQIFPNAILITSPYYISFMVIMPVTASQTTVEYTMLLAEAPQTEKARDVAARSFDLIQKVFGGEDFRAAEISQIGLDSGALDVVTYGGMESTIPMYYDELEARF